LTFRIARPDNLPCLLLLFFALVHSLGETRFSVDESFSSVTHAPDYTELDSIVITTTRVIAGINGTRAARMVYDGRRMADQSSFDITSTIDLQEVDNALNQARKEVAQRYDFKGSKASIDFDQKESKLILVADDAFKLGALWEIVQTRLVRRNVPTKNLTPGEITPAANSTVRQEVALQQGIPSEKARDIVKFIKDAKVKRVQASIQGDQLRVTSPSRDDLQEVMRLLREQDFGVALQFGNYRG
jgi:uncharacterized protein YajQ (UPF0234 family)